MISLPGFNDWLNEAVEEQAAQAEQSADSYVAQAVAARLMSDVTRRNEDNSGLLEQLEDVNIHIPKESAEPNSVIVNPERLAAVQATGLLDAPSDKAYERIVDMAATALATPGAAVTLIDRDRQFLVAVHGSPSAPPELRQTTIDRAVCQYVVAAGQPLVIDDARLDPVLQYNPAVTDGTVVAYLGIPLIDDNDHTLGSLCVWDTSPRHWTAGHVTILRDLAELATNRMFDR